MGVLLKFFAAKSSSPNRDAGAKARWRQAVTGNGSAVGGDAPAAMFAHRRLIRLLPCG